MENIFVIDLDMENQSVEDIAKSAAEQIIVLTDELMEKQKQEKVEK